MNERMNEQIIWSHKTENVRDRSEVNVFDSQIRDSE